MVARRVGSELVSGCPRSSRCPWSQRQPARGLSRFRPMRADRPSLESRKVVRGRLLFALCRWMYASLPSRTQASVRANSRTSEPTWAASWDRIIVLSRPIGSSRRDAHPGSAKFFNPSGPLSASLWANPQSGSTNSRRVAPSRSTTRTFSGWTGPTPTRASCNAAPTSSSRFTAQSSLARSFSQAIVVPDDVRSQGHASSCLRRASPGLQQRRVGRFPLEVAQRHKEFETVVGRLLPRLQTRHRRRRTQVFRARTRHGGPHPSLDYTHLQQPDRPTRHLLQFGRAP